MDDENSCFDPDASLVSAEDVDDEDEEANHDYDHRGVDERSRDVDVDDDDDLGLEEDNDDNNTAVAEIARRENVAVSWLKIIFLSVMSIAATIVSYTVYQAQHIAQKNAYEEALLDSSKAIMNKFQNYLPNTMLAAMDNIAEDFITYQNMMPVKNDGMSLQQQWPFVTLPDFKRRATNFMRLTDSERLFVFPVASNKNEWETYSVEHYQEWLNMSSVERLSNNVLFDTTIDFQNPSVSRLLYHADNKNIGIHPFIYNYTKVNSPTSNASDTEVTGPGPFLPLWETYPIIPSETNMWVNLDAMTVPGFASVLDAVLKEQRAILGPSIQWNNIMTAGGQPQEEPLTPLYYPIVIEEKDNEVKQRVVGILSAQFSWKSVFANTLPASAKGVVLVLRNNCTNNATTTEDPSYLTYQLNGQNITFLGHGDLHSKKFERTLTDHSGLWKSFQSIALNLHTTNLTESPISFDDAHCKYDLDIYPSEEMYDHYVTRKPLVTTGIVASMFLFVYLLFNAYDLFVERRQKIVMNHAVRSDDILASLFPENVRGRLFGATATTEAETNDTNGISDSHTINNMLVVSNDQHFGDAGDSSVNYEYNVPLLGCDAIDNSPSRKNGIFNAGKGNRKTGIHSSVASGQALLENGENRKSFISKNTSISVTRTSTKPIADLFPNATVIFADISGFTAWSSLRDPCQVFMLLESVYHAFDRIARRRGVFKIETIGDSYVAVTGCPDPQPDHALIMSRFARDCRVKFKEVTRQLELSLGPDTSDLLMRFGLNSGPVTAGVLRGEKSRFQLFGDTVNTAARMESTGEKDRIQMSQSTADILIECGKGHWVRPRDELVYAKGKGSLQTYWLEAGNNARSSISSVSSEESNYFNGVFEMRSAGISAPTKEGATLVESSASNSSLDTKCLIWGSNSELISDEMIYLNKQQRLIDYNVDLLASLLKQVIARRKAISIARRASVDSTSIMRSRSSLDNVFEEKVASSLIEEVKEVIRLPNFDAVAYKEMIDPDSIEFPFEVQTQLQQYVAAIANLYRSTPFHNFEHASHVTMSLNKLLQRVVTPSRTSEITAQASPQTLRRRSLLGGAVTAQNLIADSNGSSSSINFKQQQRQIASDLHNYTYGITSDPLTQFAVVFGALIHDMDHQGVSNSHLIKEEMFLAEKYDNMSIQEQNSFDLAWNLLMDDDQYHALQQCIFPTRGEYQRFRQVVVNVVMATDCFDEKLNEIRERRWNQAFNSDKDCTDWDDENRKATIVIEHLMQASDVAHTMQHWHIYQKWNRRLFDEQYTAFRAGRVDIDPSTWWYMGELKFFQGYVIPLAKKLKDCNVFGVASDECLLYAENNKKEWETKGEQIVIELVANFLQRETEEIQLTQFTEKRGKRRFARRRSLMTTGG